MPTINYNAALPAFSSISGRSSIDINKWVSELKFNISSLIKSLFANGEQGFFYDPNDLSTMFRDAGWTTPVTGTGQPVGLMFDKSKGFPLSLEKVINSDFDSDTAWTKIAGTTISGGSAILNNVSGNPVLSQVAGLVPNAWYDVTVVVSELSVGAMILRVYGSVGSSDTVFNMSSSGTYNTKIKARSDATGLIGFSAATTSAKIDRVSFREVASNYAYQTTASMRPLLVASPQRLDYDIADDKLITTLPAQLTGCTVIRSVPNVGTQILTNQTIPATYEDNTDHCGLIVVNRALTPSETSAITREFNKRAGV
ncbi:hypothetical protein [Acinetobacter sp. YH1901141]|uniref:hypothetical protein n=1 Tax=Acinetobacter sp. YH1901141 TaxID=2601201 RepID=UPI0015D16A59|nr:hypothetical protein [Acinetobacter sp. YH1901141]